jgi:hypothetical protein
LKAQPVWLFEIDEQHADLRVPQQITHGIKHPVAVVTGKRNSPAIQDANEPRIATLVRDGGPALVIYGRQKEHIPTFDESLVFWRNFRPHYTFFNVVSQRARVEALLQ